MVEKDRLGLAAHEPGAKLDAGKPRMTLIYRDMAHALEDVAKVGTFGANKYSDRGWKSVPNAEERYFDALIRHMNKIFDGEITDPDSGLSHYAHLAWNALAISQIVYEEDYVEGPTDPMEGLEVPESRIKYPDLNSPTCDVDVDKCVSLNDKTVTPRDHVSDSHPSIEIKNGSIPGIREVARVDILEDEPTPEKVEMTTSVNEAQGLEKSGSFLFTQEDIDLMSQGRLSRRLKDMDLTKEEVQDILRNGFYEVIS